MPQSLDQVYLHTVFSTKDRFAFFRTPQLQRELHAHLATVAGKLNCTALKVGGVADHVHLLTRLPRTLAIAEFVKETKRVSCIRLQERGDEWTRFRWQVGYGVFSVSHSQVEKVTQYIAEQPEHHRNQTFEDEYRGLLKRHQVDYDERYVWD